MPLSRMTPRITILYTKIAYYLAISWVVRLHGISNPIFGALVVKRKVCFLGRVVRSTLCHGAPCLDDTLEVARSALQVKSAFSMLHQFALMNPDVGMNGMRRCCAFIELASNTVHIGTSRLKKTRKWAISQIGFFLLLH